MKMGFNLELSQRQELVMTTELRQAIEILQYNSIELNHFIDEQLLENPTLEKEIIDDKIEKIDWEAVSDDSYHNRYDDISYSTDYEDYNYEEFVSKNMNLKEFLETQLVFSNLDEKYYDIARYLINSVGTNGYLEYDNEKIHKEFDISDEMINEVILYLQEFEPVGVCARDIKECLLIQLYRKDEENIIAKKIVNDYLEDLSENNLKKIAAELNQSVHKIQEIVDYIKTLEPKPGRIFNNVNTKYIEPDVIVEKIEGEYRITISNYTAPRLFLSSFYKKIIKDSKTKENEKEYIKKKMQKALFLIRSIEQRRDTIYRVVEEIVKKQYDFFEKGALFLKTLNMKDVADDVEVHESTVSRTANGKYLQCSHGLFELKYFFQAGIQTENGGISAESIKLLIKKMVNEEDKNHPISDQKITDQLDQFGISCSRRTITKYREAIGIKSSRKRKRF
ncbi:RNA polymerase factor sigma-54 [Clostridiaceae bacterium HSG29]|nr:RNA polymerase factor sigma-54 [Clostridiaceae bacterium HSG29]